VKVSVVIPAYNAERTIDRCLQSVVTQQKIDDCEYEIVVVDDASTDGTKKKIKKYPVRLIDLVYNLGPAAARNRGVKETKGDIVVFIDADIEIKDRDALAKINELFVKRLDIFGVIMIKDKKALNKGLTPKYWALYKYYLWNLPGDFQSSFTTERSAVRREVFNKVGYFNEKYKKADVEDFEFGYRLDKFDLKVLIARDIKVLHHFETFVQSIKKIIKRSWQWIRLFIRRKKFDPVYSSRERGVKTLIASTLPVFVILSVFQHGAIYLLVLALSIYLFYSVGFYFFLLKERQVLWILPFLLLDILFCTLTVVGAGASVINYLVTKNE